MSETEVYLEKLVLSPLNGSLGFVIVLPPSALKTGSSTDPVLTALDEGKVIGHAGIWEDRRNELCFMIGHAYWKQGYMTEVLATLVPIFWEQGLKEVYADVSPKNDASIRVLRNFGFHQVGENIAELRGGWCVSLRMELSKPDDDDDDDEEEEEEADEDDEEEEEGEEEEQEEEQEEEEEDDDGEYEYEEEEDEEEEDETLDLHMLDFRV